MEIDKFDYLLVIMYILVHDEVTLRRDGNGKTVTVICPESIMFLFKNTYL